MPIKMKEIFSSAKGLRSENSSDYGNEVPGIEQQGTNELQGTFNRTKEGEYEDFSPEHSHADSSCETTNLKIQNDGSSPNVDLSAGCLLTLQIIKEALENEVMKLREIGADISVNDVAQDIPPEFLDIDQTFKQSISEFLQSGEGEHEFFSVSHSVLDNRDVEADVDELCMRQIEADVEYLAFRLTFENLKVAALDQISILKEQEALASKQTHLLQKLGDTEKKVMLLNSEAEKLQNIYGEITFADETSKIPLRIVKYTSYFFLQLIGLIIVLGRFMFQISQKYVNVVPT